MSHFIDTLLDRIRDAGAPVCVGFDPVYQRLPAELRERVAAEGGDEVEAIVGFAAQVFQVLVDHVPCVKVQSACFERYGSPGAAAYEFIVQQARAMGLMVIGDVKRGDIGTSAAHYAAGLLDPAAGDGADIAVDAITINSYFGSDGLTPFLGVAAEHDKGVFALVRTSNPGGDAIQSLKLEDGRTVAEAVGELVAEIGSDPKYIGESGYSLLGAVVGATKPGDAARLREIMPQQLFLVPGFGAQGGSADDIRACFKEDGTGAIITASRSITYAYEKTPGDGGDHDWLAAIEAATIEMKQQVSAILD